MIILIRKYFLVLSIINATVLKNEKRNKTILISFDGMRWDYLDKYGPFQNFDLLRKNGVYTDGLQSQFVTKKRVHRRHRSPMIELIYNMSHT